MESGLRHRLAEKMAGEITLSDSPGKTLKKWRLSFDISQGQLSEYLGERGLHTVKLFVFAGMTAFVILATLGFYLIARLTEDATRMANTIEQMQATMQPMGQNMMVMTQSLMNMTESVNRIQYSAGHMDRSFSGPMNTINRFMPFGGGGGDRAAYPPTPFVPQHYSAPPANAYMGQPIARPAPQAQR